MAVTGTILPKRYDNVITRHEQKKQYCHMQHLLEINENKQKTGKKNSYPILCPLWHLHRRKHIKMKIMQFRIYFNVADQVHNINKEKLLQNADIWSLKSKIHQWNISNHALLEPKKSASHWDRKWLLGTDAHLKF